MTEKAKTITNRWLEFIPKAITPALLVLIIWKGGIYVQKAEDRQFDSIQDKVRVIDHVDESMTDVELYHLKNHVANPDYHMPKSAKDSVYVTKKEFYEMYGKTATQVYQINQSIKELKD